MRIYPNVSNANQFTVMPSLDITKCMWYQDVSPTVDQEQFYIMLDMSELTEPSYLPWISQHSFTSCRMLLFTPFKMNPVLHLVGCVGTYRTTLSPLDKLNNSFISCRIWLSSTISPIKRSHTVLYRVWIWAPDLG